MLEAKEAGLIAPFEIRAVAFLDVLGFKELINAAETTANGMAELRSLINEVDAHVSFDNQGLDKLVPVKVHPDYIFVFDSIIISVPIYHQGYDGLAIVALKSVQIAQKLLDLGFIVRGGLSVGPVMHEKKNIFGNGYIGAYLAQEKVAKHPRTIMTDKAKAHFQKAVHLSSPLHQLDLWVKYENELILDTFHPSYLPKERGTIENSFKHYKKVIYDKLLTLPLGEESRSKWEWMAGFFNSALKRHQINHVTGLAFDTLPIP